MRVYAYPGDMWGCGSYRVTWPAMAVSADPAFRVTITEPGSRQVSMEVDRDGVVRRESFPDDADVVVFQRPTNAYLAQVIPILRARGVAVVIDMDDDLGRIHPKNPAHAALAKRVTQGVRDPWTGVMRAMTGPNLHAFSNASGACRQATLVTVTTPALARRYGAHGRVRVIPNYVPARYLDVPRADSDLIGWGGSVHSHPDDLQQVGPAMARLVQRGHRFATVGDPAGVTRALGLRSDEAWHQFGVADLEDWPAAIGAFGIGIAPLADTQFNHAKSRLKPLELNAVGVPAVVSPADDYRAWAAMSPGTVVVDRPRAWEAVLRDLAGNPARRAEMSEGGRAVAGENTIEGNAWRWAEAWVEAAATERRKVPAGVT